MSDDQWFQRQIAEQAEKRRREKISPLWIITAVAVVSCVLFALGSIA